MHIQLKLLSINPIKENEIGTIKDNDGYFRQLGFGSGDAVAVFSCSVNSNEYTIKAVSCGEQKVSVCYASDNDAGDLMPTDCYEGDDSEYDLVELNLEDEIYLAALQLEKETGAEYLQHDDSCWLDIDIFKGKKKVATANDVFENIKDIQERFTAQYLHDILNGAQGVS